MDTVEELLQYAYEAWREAMLAVHMGDVEATEKWMQEYGLRLKAAYVEQARVYAIQKHYTV